MDSLKTDWTVSCPGLFKLLANKPLEEVRNKLVGKPVFQKTLLENYSTSIRAIGKIDDCPAYVEEAWKKNGGFWLVLENGYVIVISGLESESPFYVLFINGGWQGTFDYGLTMEI